MSSEAGISSERELRLEDRLALNTFDVDDKPFIVVKTEMCNACTNKPCLYVCPSKVYRWENERLVYNTEGCIELGACLVVCHKLGNKAITWDYPRGGKGVTYRYG